MIWSIRSWARDNSELLVTTLIQLSLVLFILGFHALTNTTVIVCTALVLFINDLKANMRVLSNKYFLSFISFLLLTAVSVLWSANTKEGLKYVELRLLLLLFPYIFCSVSISVKSLRKIFLTFISALILGLIVGGLNSSYNYWLTVDSGYFYNDNLVGILNKQATYFSIYINCGIIALVYLYNRGNNVARWIFLGIGATFVFALLLLAVRTSILTFVLLIILISIYQIIKNASRKKGILGIIGLFFVLLLIFTLPQTANRFKSLTTNLDYQFDNPNPVNHFNGEITSDNWNGLNLRRALWHCGKDIIKQQPLLGVGGGDYKEAMITQFESKNFKYALQQNFGIHNQFLYAWISFGAIGLLVFLSSILIPMIFAYDKQNFLFLAFILIFLISFLTENTLNRYIGVYFYGLFNSLLFFCDEK